MDGDLQRVILLSYDGQNIANKIITRFLETYSDAVNHSSPHNQTTLSCIWGFPICRLIHPQYLDRPHHSWFNEIDQIIIVHLSDHRPEHWHNQHTLKEMVGCKISQTYCT